MPVQRINQTFTALQETSMQTAITQGHASIPFAVNLTTHERGSIPNIQDERYPYAQRCIEIHAPANPNMVSGFAGTLAEAQTDWDLINKSDNFILQLLQLVEKLQDTRHAAAGDLYAFFREFYRMAQAAAANQVPGADAVVADLEALFAGQGAQGQPPIV
jgi:hypothetical protein